MMAQPPTVLITSAEAPRRLENGGVALLAGCFLARVNPNVADAGLPSQISLRL